MEATKEATKEIEKGFRAGTATASAATMAQARIDALAEAGTQAIHRLLQRAQGADAAHEQRADGQALPDPRSSDIDHLAQAV